MTLSFYWASGSPPSWRVMLALEHKKLAYDAYLLSFSAGDLKKPEYLAINPRAKVPAIVDEGVALYESVAIMEYIDQRYPDSGSRLYPRDPLAAAKVRRIVQEVDQYFAPAATTVARQIFTKPAGERNAVELADARAKLVEELGRLGAVSEEGFLAGPLSAADFALYPLLAGQRRVALREPSLGVIDAISPSLADWMKRIEALPYFDKTYPPHWRT